MGMERGKSHKLCSKEGERLPVGFCSGQYCGSGSLWLPPRSCRKGHTACSKSQSWEPRTPLLGKGGEWTDSVRKVVRDPMVLTSFAVDFDGYHRFFQLHLTVHVYSIATQRKCLAHSQAAVNVRDALQAGWRAPSNDGSVSRLSCLSP